MKKEGMDFPGRGGKTSKKRTRSETEFRVVSQDFLEIATVSEGGLFRRAGVLSVADMHKVEEAIKTQLDIH